MHYLVVLFLFAKNKKSKGRYTALREAQNLWVFVVTDFELKISLKSLANSSKSLCLTTCEEISLQPSCLLRHPQPKWEGGRTCTANSHKGCFWNKNRNLQHAPVSGFVSWGLQRPALYWNYKIIVSWNVKKNMEKLNIIFCCWKLLKLRMSNFSN